MIDNLAKIVLDNGGKIAPLIIPGNLTDGTGLCNVSVFIDTNGEILANIRHVHYSLYHSEFNQKFYCKWGCLAYLNPEDDISLKTGNYLCKLNPETLEVDSYQKIDTSNHDIPPVWDFHGLEDVRVFRWDDIFYVCGVRRDVKPDGEGRMELCEVNWDENNCVEVTRDRIEPPSGHTYLEKNWMPVLDMPFHYVKWANPTELVKVDPITGTSETISSSNTINLPRDLRGGTQILPFKDGYFAITHEVDLFKSEEGRKDAIYYHRFIVWDKNFNIIKTTPEFHFMDADVEFSIGMAEYKNDYLITFGFQDNAAYLLRAPKTTIEEFING